VRKHDSSSANPELPDTWSLEDLASRLGLADIAPIKMAASFWTAHGVLKALPSINQYQLLEIAEDDGNASRKPLLNLPSWCLQLSQRTCTYRHSATAEVPSGPTEAEMAQQVAQMEVFWKVGPLAFACVSSDY
jgi:hypothetical protein